MSKLLLHIYICKNEKIKSIYRNRRGYLYLICRNTQDRQTWTQILITLPSPNVVRVMVMFSVMNVCLFTGVGDHYPMLNWATRPSTDPVPWKDRVRRTRMGRRGPTLFRTHIPHPWHLRVRWSGGGVSYRKAVWSFNVFVTGTSTRNTKSGWVQE